MTDSSQMSEMSQSSVEHESDTGEENGGVTESNIQDVTMENESEDEGIQTTRKRSKRMVIDDDDDDDDDNDGDAGDSVNGNSNENDDTGVDGGRTETEGDLKETSDNVPAGDATRSPAPKGKRSTKKKMTVDEVLSEVLRDSDKDEEAEKSDEGPEDKSDDEESEQEESQGPMKFDGDLFDAEDSSDNENDLDRAAGPEYDSAEDKNYEDSLKDKPELMKKIKKLKGAAKKPRQQKSRKCKPTKDDMLALRSESQRLIRETRVSLPYHRPAPKTLQDFLARAQKKQEVYKDLKRGTLDIEKARIIQEKIVEYSVEKLPSFHHKRHSSKRKEKQSSVAESQQSLPDSGIVSGGLDTQSQDSELCEASEKHEDLAPCPVGEDELPDIEISNSRGLSDSQHALKESGSEGHSQNALGSACGVENKDSQHVSDLDEAVVEQVDSPPVAKESQSQPIEDVDSVKGDSQRSESVTDVVPESLESDMCDEVGVESEAVASALTDKSERLVKTDSKVINCEAKQSCEDDSGIENDFNKQLNASSPMNAALQNKKSADKDAVTEQASEEAGQMNLKTARQKLVEELAQKGVMPAFGKGGGDFIVLEEGSKDVPVKEKKSNIDRLLERLMHHYPKKETKKSKNVEISIVEQTGEGQKKELTLKTVTYRTEGEPDLDLSSIAHISGNRLQALKQKLEVGMRKKRVAAYERRQQLYKMENEEGYEEKAEEDGLPAEEEEAELTDGSDTEAEEEEEEEEEEMDLVDEKEDRNNPFLDDEAEDDEDDDDYDDSPRQSPVCAEINDMKEDEEDLFQDPDRLQLRLDESDEEEDENQDNEEEKETKEETNGLGPGRMSQRGTQRLLISDDEDGSQLQSAQDPTKTCDPNIAGGYLSHRYSGGNLVKDSLDLSFEMLTPMSRLLQDTQPSSSLPSTQPVEDSQDLCDSPMSQILDADGYFRVPSSQPRRLAKPALLMEGSQDAGDDHMDMLVGLCSGQFAEAGEGAVPSSGGFDGLFDNSSQSQDDRGSLTSLFDSSSQSQHAIQRDSLSEGDSTSRSDVISKGHTGESVDMSQGRLSLKSANSKSLAASEPQQDKGSDRGDNMAEALRLSSGAFPSSEFQNQSQSQDGKKRGVKRRLIIQDDSSDEEGEGSSNRFLLLSDDEGTKGSDKNELSESDEEDHDSEMEEPSSFRGFKDKGKLLQQFVENEAELSGSEAESDENLDLEEEEDYMEVEAGDQDHLNEDQLRDQVGRVHMKQMLDDDDRQLMRYKEMYLPDGDLYSEGGGRQRRFHWKHLGDDESQNDLFAHPSDEEKDEGEDPDEKQWRMERYEREKFLESQQQENVTADGEEENSQFMKFGQFFMKRQVSDPAPLPQQPTLTKPKLARSQSVVDKSSPGKFLKPKIPKRGSFLARSKENLARIAEITKAAGLNVNGTRGSRSFVFSVNSSDKGDEGSKEQLLNKAAAKASAVKKITPHKPPAKRKCVQPAPKPQTQNSIFKLL